MKGRGANGSGKRKVVLRSHLSQPMERLKDDDSRYHVGLRIFWVVLGAACAVLAWVLFTILLR
jgi:hypothetical protein